MKTAALISFVRAECHHDTFKCNTKYSGAFQMNICFVASWCFLHLGQYLTDSELAVDKQKKRTKSRLAPVALPQKRGPMPVHVFECENSSSQHLTVYSVGVL